MLKDKKILETNKYELVITIDAEAFEGAVERSYKHNVEKINVPGFRKGKAPRALIEKRYGSGVFYEDAFEELYPAAFDAAVKEGGLIAVSRPEIEITTIGKEGVEFKAAVWVKPEITVGEYKGLKIERPDSTVTDAEIDAEIDRERERNSRVITVEGAAENGLIANIDFEGFVDGVAFEGGSSKGYDLTLGSGSFIPGFEDQILGHCASEEFDVNVGFPADYGAEHLAGKSAVFKVKLNELKKKELPALDDEFAKDVSDKDTFADYRAGVAERLQKNKDAKADDEVSINISKAVVELVGGDIPEVMFENATDDALRDFERRIRAQGLSFEQYMQYTQSNPDEMRANFREQATARVKARLAFEKIAELEKFEITPEEIEAEYAKLAERYHESVDVIRKYISAEELTDDLKVNRAVELVRTSAVIGKPKKATKKAAKSDAAEPTPTQEPAKKPAAKKKAAPKAEAAPADAEPKPKKPAAKKAAPKE